MIPDVQPTESRYLGLPDVKGIKFPILDPENKLIPLLLDACGRFESEVFKVEGGCEAVEAELRNPLAFYGLLYQISNDEYAFHKVDPHIIDMFVASYAFFTQALKTHNIGSEDNSLDMRIRVAEAASWHDEVQSHGADNEKFSADMVRGIASYYGIHSSDELDIVYELIRATEMNFNLMTGKGLLDEKDGGILESTESELLSIAKKAICLADMGHILFSDKHYYRRRKLLAYEFAKKDFWSEIVLKYAPSSEEDGTSSEEDCTKSKETASEAASGARPDKAIVEFDTNWLKVQGDYIKNQEIRLFPGDVQVNLNYLIWLDKFPEFFDPKSITILKQRLKNRLKNDFLKPCEKDAISIIADGTQFLLQGVKCPVSGQPRDINVNCIPEDFQLYMEAIQSLGFVVVETREP